MIAARTLIAGSAGLLFTAASCRSLEVCGAICAAPAGSGGMATGDGSARAGGGEGGEQLGGTGTAEPLGGGGAGDSGAAGDAGLEPLQCDAGSADCDYSRLTGCETHPSWAIRHCGACGVSCEDGCSAGKCLQSLLLTSDAEVASFVSTNSFAFATLSTIDGTHPLIRVRLDEGKTDVLLTEVGSGAKVALGDRVYLFDSDSGRIRSFLLDGSDPRVEEVPDVWDMGAYPGGQYYTGRGAGSDEGGALSLYYRRDASSPWQELDEDLGGSFVASSGYGVVLSRTDADQVEQLYLLREDRVIPYGPALLDTEDVLATPEGITVLTYDYGTAATELWWLTDDLTQEPKHYALPPQHYFPRMRPYRDIVAVNLVDGKSAYVQTFDKSGPQVGKLGVRLGSVLIGLDNHYLWHMVTDDLFHWRFLRTEWDLFGF